MHAPQIIYIALVSINVGATAMMQGQPKTGTYSVWTQIVSSALFIGLLTWGGFFR